MKVSYRALLAVLAVAILMSSVFYYWRSQTLYSKGFDKFKTLDDLEENGLGNFNYLDFNGKSVTQSDFKNKVVILNAWASWCSPCVEEMPSLFEATKHFKGKISLLAVSLDQNEADARKFLEAFPDSKTEGVTFLFDKDSYFSNRLKIDKLPETFIINKNGKIVKKVVGTMNWSSKGALEYLQSLEDQ
jgi:thiol-disulfide isomerase/thioredoxin